MIGFSICKKIKKSLKAQEFAINIVDSWAFLHEDF